MNNCFILFNASSVDQSSDYKEAILCFDDEALATGCQQQFQTVKKNESQSSGVCKREATQL